MITDYDTTPAAQAARRQEVAYSTYLAADLAADLLAACQTAAVRQVGRCDDADDAAMIATLSLAPRIVGADLTADDLRAAAWQAVRTVVRRQDESRTAPAGDSADLADLADTPAAYLTTGETPDPAAPYATRAADLLPIVARIMARSADPDTTAAVLAAVANPDTGATGPAVVGTAVRLMGGGALSSRKGRTLAPVVRRYLAALPRVGQAATARLAVGAEDTPYLRRNVTTGRLAAYAASTTPTAPVHWDDTTADLAARQAATPDHLAVTPARPSRSSAVVTTGRPAPWAAVVVTVGTAVVATYLPGTDASAWLTVGADDYRPTTADRAADGFAARQESPGPVRKPSARRKGGSGSTGPTVPARLSR